MNGYKRHNKFGLTLVELLVALMVGSIILGAVATLAYAMGAANRSGDEICRAQAQVRYATLRISELIRYAKLVTLVGDDLALWRADGNTNNQIDPSELVYVEAGSARDYIKLVEFPSAAGEPVLLSSIKDGSAKNSLIALYDERRIEIIPQCSSVAFYPAVINEQTGFVGVGFDISEGGTERHYEITGVLRSRADYLLDGSSIVANDDD